MGGQRNAVDIGHSASRSDTEVLGNMSITRNLGGMVLLIFLSLKDMSQGHGTELPMVFRLFLDLMVKKPY